MFVCLGDIVRGMSKILKSLIILLYMCSIFVIGISGHHPVTIHLPFLRLSFLNSSFLVILSPYTFLQLYQQKSTACDIHISRLSIRVRTMFPAFHSHRHFISRARQFNFSLGMASHGYLVLGIFFQLFQSSKRQ